MSEQKYYDLNEVAQLLGVNKRKVMYRIKRNEIPAVKVCSVYRIPIEDTDAWVKEYKPLFIPTKNLTAEYAEKIIQLKNNTDREG